MAKRWNGTKSYEIIKIRAAKLHPSITSRQACDEMMRDHGDVFKKEGRLDGKSDSVYRKFCDERQKVLNQMKGRRSNDL
ncbi:hypothetical protein [Neobacillus mesonae]|uniref:hypothetical protein n=1 Tax=Neobacillus mesonae TaxID=1193713 RepID=UPI0020425E39|nr:hypothetical protein [Neobacillus mesonae]MCM3570255.1 hypothetical protein [Neobacillus mesonae]